MNNPDDIKQETNPKQESQGTGEVVDVKNENEDGKKDQKEPKKEKSTKKGPSTTILEEKSVNLIPVMSREEIKEEEKKKKMNKGSLISLLLLFVVSILIVGFSIISQIQLNYQKEKLFELEDRLGVYNQVIIDNNHLLQRVLLYSDVQEGRYSTTEIVDYVQSVLARGTNTSVSSFNFTGRTGINFAGQTRDLEELSKIWYLLTNDPKLERVNLRSLSKASTSVSFNFEANIILDEFTVFQGE